MTGTGRGTAVDEAEVAERATAHPVAGRGCGIPWTVKRPRQVGGAHDLPPQLVAVGRGHAHELGDDVHRQLARHLTDQVELVAIRDSRPIVREPRIRGQVRAVDRTGDALEDRRRAGGERNVPPVAGEVDIPRRDERDRVSSALRNRAEPVVEHDLHADQREERLVDGEIHDLPFTGFVQVPLAKRHERRERPLVAASGRHQQIVVGRRRAEAGRIAHQRGDRVTARNSSVGPKLPS